MAADSIVRARALDAFRDRFVRPPDFFVRAPGRVNLIGEHTDYSEGLVLPCAIDRALWLAVDRRDDEQVRVFATDLGDAGREATFSLGEATAYTGFSGYVQGVIAAFRERGVAVRGMDLAIASDVPVGSGLSSSAALGVAVSLAVDRLAASGLERDEIARVAHRGESHFVGTGCGVLDPFAIALGQRDHVLRIDCRSFEVRPVPLPGDQLTLLISHCGITRRLAAHAGALDPGSGYRERVSQCQQALASVRRQRDEMVDARSLRDVPMRVVEALEAEMEPLLWRRMRHVVSEIARVDRVCEALVPGEGRAPDLTAVGQAVREAHASLRDDYEVSIPELDALCEDADRLEGVLGSRLLGAGFGGCALHLVRPEAADRVRAEIAARFRTRFGRTPPVFALAAGEGASIEPA